MDWWLLERLLLWPKAVFGVHDKNYLGGRVITPFIMGGDIHEY
jgi:hypothetical protein